MDNTYINTALTRSPSAGAPKLKDKKEWHEFIDINELGYIGAEGYFYAGRGLNDPFPHVVATTTESVAETNGCGQAKKESSGASHFKDLDPRNPKASKFYKLLDEHIEPDILPSLMEKYYWTKDGYYLTRKCKERLKLLSRGKLDYESNGPPCVPFLSPNP